MSNYFEMASVLESATAELQNVRNLLAITLEEIFATDSGLIPYHLQFSSVVDAANDKVIKQISIIDEIVDELYKINRENKGV